MGGPIPDSFDNLEQLVYCELDYNLLASIPHTIGAVKNLQHFSVHEEQGITPNAIIGICAGAIALLLVIGAVLAIWRRESQVLLYQTSIVMAAERPQAITAYNPEIITATERPQAITAYNPEITTPAPTTPTMDEKRENNQLRPLIWHFQIPRPNDSTATDEHQDLSDDETSLPLNVPTFESVTIVVTPDLPTSTIDTSIPPNREKVNAFVMEVDGIGDDDVDGGVTSNMLLHPAQEDPTIALEVGLQRTYGVYTGWSHNLVMEWASRRNFTAAVIQVFEALNLDGSMINELSTTSLHQVYNIADFYLRAKVLQAIEYLKHASMMISAGSNRSELPAYSS
ncbi:hypothetical protein HDU76_000024 [Blyttiomyces sp. JEL0837]|nr:hypothetical protein HDU76_000024 [Blyttiomyces sp. JEL0837]